MSAKTSQKCQPSPCLSLSENRDTPIGPPDLTVPNKKWTAFVTRKHSDSGSAYSALSTAYSAKGGDPAYLLSLLYQYCISGRKASVTRRRDHAGLALREAEETLAKCEDLQKNLRRWGDEERIKQLGFVVANPRINLLLALKRFTVSLKLEIEAHKHHVTGKATDPDDWWLFLLATEVETTTGKPHLEKIATLVEFGLLALPPEIVEGNTDSQKHPIASRRNFVARLEGFKQRFPIEADSISSLVFPKQRLTQEPL